MNGKPWYASKTLWVNVIALGTSVATLAFGVDPAKIAEATGVGLPIINVVLRLITGEPITISSSDVSGQ